ncbi:hypothetical protein LCGC14_2792360 [marine sediment metagenome]|uniref:Uncharacterized protein n=1 Tax=marine sediment metagenome TaxID=412755 RepID=A0A0F8YQ94_9ZZZZ
MAAGLRSVAKRIIDFIVYELERKLETTTITGSPLKAARPMSYPLIWVRRGTETTFDTEHGSSAIMDLNVILDIKVQDSNEPETALENMIQSVDNVILNDVRQNDQAIGTWLIGIEEPDYYDKFAITTITYNVRYQYVFGSR